MTTLQKSLIVTTLFAVIGAGIYETRRVSQLREQAQANRQLQVSLAAQEAGQLQRERDDATQRLAGLQKENERLKNLAAMQRETIQQEHPIEPVSEETRASASPVAPNSGSEIKELPKDTWADVGFDTPENALRTRGWSVLTGNRERFAESIYLTDAARKLIEDAVVSMAAASNDPDKERLIREAISNKWGAEEAILMPIMALNQRNGFTGYRILSEQSPNPDERIFDLETAMAFAPGKKETVRFRRFDKAWKVIIDEDTVKSANGDSSSEAHP